MQGWLHRRMVIALALGGVLALCACGVRGSLEKPPGVQSEAGDAPPGKPAPHKPSILDPLLR
jgi:predicted small lipoprotein YifL